MEPHDHDPASWFRGGPPAGRSRRRRLSSRRWPPRGHPDLADLGARVIKVERPGPGDFARGYDEAVLGLPATSSG